MLKKVNVFVFGLLLSIVLLLTSVEIVSFSSRHYEREFEKHHISTITGMDMKQLQYVIEELLAYLRDERDDLHIIATVAGEEREVFGERERLHMVDVKELFVVGRKVRNSGVFLLGILLVIGIKKDKGWKKSLSETLMFTAIVNLGLMAALSLLVYFDFTKYFDYFHFIFFDNDLWMLNPETEILIQMLPEKFFYNTAVQIAMIYITTIIALGVGGFFYNKKTDFTG
ncbi:TIGR01906 family membrane protein [Clostridium formicaceticum]|uniref:TIGR01906 family membrane protein n=1 Tax=Clostridium formicaceticum TaxID=1497 RepID=A0AAC9RHZ1_9CLOT|nr:TIGR01906 family membrane protein [Clostridium formicaceticum]AOY75822.1 hypothetical protein BJL90_07855 [Clostridium formicaceticum]ARE86152.1 hypothetical protein CLFO_04680 [Clostridium formicaceticum]